MDALAVTLELIRRFEGLYASPYLCPAGVPTIGYGATYYEDGTRVALTDSPITRERAEALLLWHVKSVYFPAVLRWCPAVIHETPGRIAALIDWTFNLGSGNLRASTLRKKVNLADWGSVPAELLKWNKAGGRVLRGLTARRSAEASLI
ncbi:lysozyme [Rhodoferax sp. GW822-FHT02A01]|uniref:lysozyme n=1 Tax=Rhodoferax sp. GW822-FHT02A01 TaxID=3141537 RepID=UPI00315D6260